MRNQHSSRPTAAAAAHLRSSSSPHPLSPALGRPVAVPRPKPTPASSPFSLSRWRMWPPRQGRRLPQADDANTASPPKLPGPTATASPRRSKEHRDALAIFFGTTFAPLHLSPSLQFP